MGQRVAHANECVAAWRGTTPRDDARDAAHQATISSNRRILLVHRACVFTLVEGACIVGTLGVSAQILKSGEQAAGQDSGSGSTR